MATMTSPTSERRHIPDRRVSQTYTTERSGAAAMSSSAGGMTGSSSSSGMRERSDSAKRMNALDWIAMVLLMIGGLNWGAVGLFDTDVVARLFGEMSPIARVIYVLIGLSALYSIYTSAKMGRAQD